MKAAAKHPGKCSSSRRALLFGSGRWRSASLQLPGCLALTSLGCRTRAGPGSGRGGPGGRPRGVETRRYGWHGPPRPRLRGEDEPEVGRLQVNTTLLRGAAGSPQSLEMAPKAKKGLKGSIDDVLSDLLGDDKMLPETPVNRASRAGDTVGASRGLPSKTGAKSLLGDDDVFGPREVLAEADAEVSEVSDADPEALLQDLEQMDADFLGLKKSHPAPGRTAAKGSGKETSPGNPKPVDKLAASERGDTAPTRRPAPSSFGHQHGRFPSEDSEDPMAGLLSNDEEEVAKKAPRTESKAASGKSPGTHRGQGPSIPLTPGDTPVRKKEELPFDEGDDLMAALGFGDSPRAEKRQMGDQGGPRPARSKLDELLARGTAASLLTRPGTGEHREFKLDKKYQRPQDREDSWGDEDLTFGAYQPTVASAEGRQSRRQSVSRFLAEGSADTKGEPSSKQSPLAASSPVHSRKGGADWLGLKDDDLDLSPPPPPRETQQGGSVLSAPSVPPPKQHSGSAGLPSLGAEPPAERTMCTAKASQASKLGASEEEDWLTHALSRKKSQALAKEERAGAGRGLRSETRAVHLPPDSQAVPSTQGVEQGAAGGTSGAAQETPAAKPDVAASVHSRGTASPVARSQAPSALPAGDPKRGAASGELPGPAGVFPNSQEPAGLSLPVQPLLPESLARSVLLGAEYQQQLLAAHVQPQGGPTQLQAELLQSQARLAELEAQVRKLELERTQHKLLLEGLQQRHQADLELIEGAHRGRVKMLETSYQQREERLRRENEELSAQLLSHRQEAEQARAELTAQHQQRLAAAVQEKEQEVERLRELQRMSIREMRKDHEEQLQRLKLLKEREIDAVTSATSHTRSLNGVIEQMERFSSSLSELSSRVEASHLTAAQERELGARQRDEQLRALQEQLGRQQRDMEEERSQLQEVIGKMEARLSEQSRLLEQERWRVNAEQSKVESTQRALEEQRKVMVQQMAMERGELDRAKTALLEEQKAAMRKCAEEQRRLVAEWADFFTQQKLSKERAEREVERALQADTQREGSLLSLAKEQAELKIKASELRAQEEQLAAARAAVERERQELQLEKEKVQAAALRLRLRAEEVESMSQVASAKYEEGERALREARQVQSAQQARLQVVQQQQEQLRQQEQRMHQEHLNLAQQRLRLDRIQQDLPSSLARLSPGAQGPAAPRPSALAAPATVTPGCSQPPASPDPTQLYARLVLLRYTAEQDRDFLENEQFFLETLKKASYNLTSHSA
ncbi:fas-binding factor 1 isoform X3 [Oryctolagus cuniculus]|uniref:fas-binding factor 1 isoform X3 n=1 Tax=Oryctolagus cuniculus TaxID=9986 RepID=UPI0038797D6C